MFKKHIPLSALVFTIILLVSMNGTTGNSDVSIAYSREQTSLISNDVTWHHDCSNASGWLIDPNPAQPRLDGIQDDVAILSDGSAIYSSSIPYAEGRWHGSVFFYELETPVYVGHGLNFEVELDHPGSSNYAGGMEVGLYDQNQNVSYWVSITDSWYSSAFVTDVAYGDGGVNYVHTTSQSGSLLADYHVWHDEVGNTIQGQDNQGTYTLASEGEFDPNREIHSIGIMFWNVESYNYESNYVLDILIGGTEVRGDIVTWHDDCSNTSTFQYLANESWFAGAMGTVNSTGGYIYATDYGTASGSHGPLYYQSFNDSITVGQLDWLEAEIEVGKTSAAIGAAAVFLFDEEFRRVALLDVADSWIAQDDVAAYAGWYTPEQTSTTSPKEWPTDTVAQPYHETLRMLFNVTGVYASIPRVGNFRFMDIEDINLTRTVSYIGVNLRTVGSSTTCEILRIHDVRVQYRLTSAVEDTTLPEVLGPSDYTYELGTTNHTITWTAFDSNPYLYALYRDYVILQYGPWNVSEIILNIDGLDLGTYLYTLMVFDISFLFAYDMVSVLVVDTTAPQIDHPDDIFLNAGHQNNSITWSPNDLKPASYEIYRNSTLVASGTWNSSAIAYSLDGLVTGLYRYTIYVYDTSGNVANDSVLVAVGMIEAPMLNLTIMISIGSAAVIVIVVVLILKTRSPPSVGSSSGYQY